MDGLEPRSRFDLETTYTVKGGGKERDFDIDWRGDVSDDGKIIEGKFKAYIGRGKFTAREVE